MSQFATQHTAHGQSPTDGPQPSKKKKKNKSDIADWLWRRCSTSEHLSFTRKRQCFGLGNEKRTNIKKKTSSSLIRTVANPVPVMEKQKTTCNVNIIGDGWRVNGRDVRLSREKRAKEVVSEKMSSRWRKTMPTRTHHGRAVAHCNRLSRWSETYFLTGFLRWAIDSVKTGGFCKCYAIREEKKQECVWRFKEQVTKVNKRVI